MKLLLGAAVLIAVGCGSKKTDPGGLPRCSTPPEEICNFATCGGNSAVINAFPINGLRSDGECSPEGVQLVPGSLDNAACAGATLSIDSQQLVGRNADGSIKCKEAELVGARFTVRSEKGEEALTIAERVEYEAKTKEKFWAYRIAWKKETETDAKGRKKGLCTSKQGQKLRKALKMKKEKFDDFPDPSPETELVIPVRSELYNGQGDPVSVQLTWKVQEKEWLNLACVEDALAKRSMHHQLTADDAKNRAALRMWTADYCGATPFTVRGEPIDWSDNAAYEVEAQFDDKKATCVSAPRILRDDVTGAPIIPPKLTKRLKALCTSNCTTSAGWMAAATTCYQSNGTTVERTIPPCTTPCTPPNCLVQSRIPKTP